MWLQVQFTDLISVLDSIPVDAAPPAPAPVTSWLPDPRPPLELWSARDTVVSSIIYLSSVSSHECIVFKQRTLQVSAGDISSLQEQLSAVYWAGDQECPDTAPADTVQLDLLAVAHKYLAGLDLQSAAKEVTKERTLATDRKKKGVKKSLMETKVLQNKNIISAFKDGKNVTLRGRGFARTAFKTDPFRTRPPNTSRPPSLHVDDFLVLEMKGQQPTGPTGYNKQSVKAAKELFALREAEAALKPPPVMREATREPVGFRGRGRGDRGGGGGGGGRGFRGSGGGSSNGRSFRQVNHITQSYKFNQGLTGSKVGGNIFKILRFSGGTAAAGARAAASREIWVARRGRDLARTGAAEAGEAEHTEEEAAGTGNLVAGAAEDER